MDQRSDDKETTLRDLPSDVLVFEILPLLRMREKLALTNSEYLTKE